MTTIELQVNELIAKQAIREVEYQFAEALDTKNWGLASSLFTDHVTTDFSAYGIPAKLVTKMELVALYQYPFRNEKLVTEHHYTNFVIEIQENEADCHFNFTGIHFVSELEGGEYFHLHGQYHDKLRKTTDGWKIFERSLKIYFFNGNASMLN